MFTSVVKVPSATTANNVMDAGRNKQVHGFVGRLVEGEGCVAVFSLSKVDRLGRFLCLGRGLMVV